jgi:hypothetical protein
VSVLTTAPLRNYPLHAAGLTITTGGSAWEYGDWVPFFTVTATTAAIAGIELQAVDSWSGAFEVEFGIGSGDVTAIGHIRLEGPSSGNGGPTAFLLPLPISGLAMGTLVNVRMRRQQSVAAVFRGTVLYYDDPDSDQVMPYTDGVLTSFPAGADSVAVVTNVTPWANSATYTFDAGLAHPTHIFGVAVSTNHGNADTEIDLGQIVEGVTTWLTTFRVSSYGANTGRLHYANLPGLYPLAEGAELIGRVRQSGVEITPVRVAFLGYEIPPQVGTLIVVKEVTGGDVGQAFDFTAGPDLSPGTFSLTNGQQQTYTDIPVGTYAVEEINIPAGWTLASVTVSNGSPSDAITVGNGETVTVTFVNTQLGALIVRKVTDPADSEQAFDFEVGPGLDPAEFDLLGGEEQVYAGIPAGTYSVEEVNVPTGWELTSIVVSNSDPHTAIAIAEGETVTVTFTNTQTSDCPGTRGSPPIGA